MIQVFFALALLSGTLLFSLCLGAESVSPLTLMAALWGDDTPFSLLLWDWRLPRAITAGMVGALLGLSGCLFQGVFRNPLAEPFLLGSAPGAALGATLAILMPMSLPTLYTLPFFAFIGALGATLLVIAITRSLGLYEIAGLLLAGVAVSAFLSATRSFLMLALSDESVSLQVVLSWTLGGVQTPFWDELLVLALVSLGGGIAAFGCARGLDVLGLGEDVAANMGMNVPKFSILVLLLASALVALAVMWGGTIGFVGLIVPHLARMWGGAMHRWTLPFSAVLGAALLMVLDGLARSVLQPADIPLGLLTAMLGAPFFIVVLARWRRS
jgi:iron complex transport system permease protein